MSARRTMAAGVLLIALSASSCAVGRFIAGAPAPGATTTSSALLERRCSGCHQTPDPGSMSAAAWQASLVRMKRRMQLSAVEWDSLGAMAAPQGQRAP